MIPYGESQLNPVVYPLRKPSERLLQTNEEEMIALIQWYANRIHTGIMLRARVRNDVERMTGLVKGLEQLGWFDANN